MRCPHCKKQIDCKNQIRRQMAKWGAKGGEISRRTLTSEQARKMVAVREAKRKQKGKEHGR
jgi:hypothetical protein